MDSSQGSKGKQKECSSWSDLPVDILNIINGKVFHFVDKIRFRAVSKNWKLAKLTQPEPKLPWLLDHQWGFDGNGCVFSSCMFHIPSSNETHTTKNIIDSEDQYDLFGAGICASKYGWLLLQKGQSSWFYNPFSNKFIKLPKMDISFNRSTFSAIPTSPDCLCFAIQSSKDSDKIYISTCSPGDEEWCTRTLDGFNKAIDDVVYSNGNFYCIFSGGVLGVFCVADNVWRLLDAVLPYGVNLPSCRARMIESNGELLAVCCPIKIFYIFRFDQSRMVWERMDSLSNRALCLGCTSFSVSAEGALSHLADRILDHGHSCTCYYTLRSNQGYESPEYYPWVIEPSRERFWIEYT